MTTTRDDGFIAETGRIENTFLGIEDHGLLTVCVMFNFGGSGQGFGHFSLGNPDIEEDCRWGIRALYELLTFLGVDQLHEAKGKILNVLRKEPYGNIEGLERLPFDGGAKLTRETWGKPKEK